MVIHFFILENNFLELLNLEICFLVFEVVELRVTFLELLMEALQLRVLSFELTTDRLENLSLNLSDILQEVLSQTWLFANSTSINSSLFDLGRLYANS